MPIKRSIDKQKFLSDYTILGKLPAQARQGRGSPWAARGALHSAGAGKPAHRASGRALRRVAATSSHPPHTFGEAQNQGKLQRLAAGSLAHTHSFAPTSLASGEGDRGFLSCSRSRAGLSARVFPSSWHSRAPGTGPAAIAPKPDGSSGRMLFGSRRRSDLFTHKGGSFTEENLASLGNLSHRRETRQTSSSTGL